MNIISTSFDRAGEVYAVLFADWLHVHFIIRTIMILFVLWLIIFLGAQVFRYVIAPVVILLFVHVFLRVWNFLFVETFHEILFIRYHKNENFPDSYLRLCDKVKRNRMTLAHTKYKGAVVKSRRLSIGLMVTCGVAATLWASAFGLHSEYAAPVLAVMEVTPENGGNYDYENGDDVNGEFVDYPPTVPENLPEIANISPPPTLPPSYEQGAITISNLPPNATFALNEEGREGTRLRSGAGIEGQTIIEILWDTATLTFLNEHEPDPYVSGLYWLRVQTEGGTEGFVSSALLELR